MKNTTTAIFACLLLLTANFVIAQEKKPKLLVLDLAELDPGQTKRVPGNKQYDRIILKNTLIDKGYSIDISKETQLVDPLPAPDFSKVSSATPETDPCNTLNMIYLRFAELFNPDNTDEKIKTEKEVSLRSADLQKELKQTKCTNSQIVDSAKNLINRCQREINEMIEVGEGDKVTIIVSRDDKTWKWEFNGEAVGRWLISYGFGFCSSALEANTYHTKQLNDTSFQVQKDAKSGAVDLTFIPAIFYSFLPTSHDKNNFNWSITAGLGFDLSAPVVFFGGGFMFHQNIGINIGLALQQQARLKPQYSENDILKESLEKDQLHDKIYRPNAFISINFRFGENPFKKNSTGNKD